MFVLPRLFDADYDSKQCRVVNLDLKYKHEGFFVVFCEDFTTCRNIKIFDNEF